MELLWWMALICGSCCIGSLSLLFILSLIGWAVRRRSNRGRGPKGSAHDDGSDMGEVIEGEYKDIVMGKEEEG
jgi:hypothetical protein